MKIGTCFYCLKQGLINIRRNLLHSLASAATISACIFLFCLLFAITENVRYLARSVGTIVGITVFFDEELGEEAILTIADQVEGWAEVDQLHYISAEAAWEEFRSEYFAGREELAEGFAQDNPLAGSASLEVFLKDMDIQEQVVERLYSIEGVRQVNHSSLVAAGLESIERVIGLVSGLVIAVLLAVSVFLIGNTISVAAAFRKNENHIMRLIGATNGFIRAPFLVEGLLLGLVGAGIPLVGIYQLYTRAAEHIQAHYSLLTGFFTPVPVRELLPVMGAVALGLGAGIGLFGSFFAIRRHLRV